jgi:hypothetical protein
VASTRGNKPKARTTRINEMADFAGVSDQTIRNWMKMPGFPKDATDSSVCLWDIPLWHARLIGGGGNGDDPEIGVGDGDSEGLERYRMARAQQEEIKLAKMRGDFISREDVHTALMETGSIMKEAGERIVRTGGNDLAGILLNAWSQVMSRLESIFGNDRAGGTIDGNGNAPE